MPKETQSSLANDVRDVEQAGTMLDFIVRYEVVPSDVPDARSDECGMKLALEKLEGWGYRTVKIS